jgi:2-polyprenyl-3-methyl-5-hydroxy-6-metoxy-1,4-benzoquinol methylase
VVRPPGYAHSAAFQEVAEALFFALRGLGRDVSMDEAPKSGRRPIVLGSNLLSHHRVELPANAILYNLEQIDPGSSWLTPPLLDLFRTHTIWDYSPANALRLVEMGLPSPKVVPIGWVPELTRIAQTATEDIDVLFYGSLNERRAAVLQELRGRGLHVHAAFGVYGPERDRLIARSKVVLNVHFYEAKVFEIVRVSYLLANRRCVVSERGADPREEKEFEDGVAFEAYGGLAERCERLCADPAKRRHLSEEGFRILSSRDLRCIVADALGLDFAAHPVPAVSRTARQTMEAQTTQQTATDVPAYFHHARPEIVARVEPAGKRILDVGCAAGAMGAAMLAAGATEVVGIEVHAPAAAIARGRVTSVFGYDIDQLPELPFPPGYFDVITLADVLEHLRDPPAVLRHLRRWLSGDGRIVCSLPNVRHESVLLPLLVHGQWDYVEAGILDRTHLRFFTLESMLRMLREAGYEPDGRVEGVGAPASPAIEQVAALVGMLGGDVDRFRRESTVIQVVIGAQPAEKTVLRPAPILDPWRGSRPVKVLVAPEMSNPDDRWTEALGTIVDGLGVADEVTVGVALPLPFLQAPPEALGSLAERSGVDLLLTEAPGTREGWERMFGGASVWVATSDRPPLRDLAARVGITVQELFRPVPEGRPTA